MVECEEFHGHAPRRINSKQDFALNGCKRKKHFYAPAGHISLLVCLAAVVFACTATRALAPPEPGMMDKYRRDGTLDQRMEFADKLDNDVIDPQLVSMLKYRISRKLGYDMPDMLPPSGRRGLPTTDFPRVLVLLMSFNEYPPNNDASEIQDELFGSGSAGDYPYESLTNYYYRSSYGKLTILGKAVGWRNMGNRSSVPETDSGREDLIVSIMNHYNSTEDFSVYDNDNDGEIDYFIVVWTGPHNGWSNFWWAYKTTFGGSEKFDGKSLGSYSWNPEYMYQPPSTPGDFKPRVIIHETGHALGLPDYYDYDDTVGPDGGVGGLDMMDANWGDHNAFSKFVYGWSEPDFYVTTSGTYSITLRDSDTTWNSASVAIMPGAANGDPFGEFFIVENRNKVGNDSNHPGTGLLIWHVNGDLNFLETDFSNNNSDTDYKLLRLMEADGLEEIETGDGNADAGDYYKNGASLTPYTTPNSKKYGGTNKQIYIANTSAPGTLMTFDLRLGTVTTPPLKSNFAPVEGATVAMSPEITFDTSINAKCRWSKSDLSYSGMSSDCDGIGTKSQTCYVTGLSSGEVTLYIACSDMFGVADGAADNEELTYGVDATFPTQSNWNPASGTKITDPSPDIMFDVSEIAWCRWSLEDKKFDDMPGDCMGDGTTSQWCHLDGIPDGDIIVYTGCRDFYYNKDTAATNVHLSYTFDGMPPAQSNWNPAQGSTLTSTTPLISFNTNETATCRWSTFDQRYSHMLNACNGAGSTSHSCSPTLGEGEVTFYIACIDTSNNEQMTDTNADVTYIVDVQPPGQSSWNPAKGVEITTSMPVITFVTGEKAWCRWSLTDLAYGSMSSDCTGEGTKNQTCATHSLSDGPEIVYISCADTAGNEDTVGSNEHVDYTVSTTTPEPFGFYPADSSTVNSATMTVTFTTNKVASCRWALTDLGYAEMVNDCSGSSTSSLSCEPANLPEGMVIVYISCDDGLGHVDTAETNTEVTFTVDTTVPAQSNWNPPRGETFASSTILLTFDTDEIATCKWSLSDQSFDAMSKLCNSMATTTHNCDVFGWDSGPIVVYTACRDAVLNRNTAETNEQLDYTVDQSAPVQSNWYPGDGSILTATSAVLTFDTDEVAACKWSADDLSYDEMSFLCDGFGSTSHTCTLGDLATNSVFIHLACSDYFFNNHDADTNTDLNYYVFTEGSVSSLAISAGWNLLGGSMEGASLDLATLFSGGFYSVVDYDGGLVWPVLSGSLPLVNGGATWVYSETDIGEVDAGGTEHTASPFEVSGGPGWALFSNPYRNEVAWSDLKASMSCDSAPADLPSIFYYSPDNGYFKVDPNSAGRIQPWRGYWINFPGNCTLSISK